MIRTQEKFRDQRILIWGYGREGKSTERFLREYCAPAVLDVYEGARDGVRDAAYDYVFVSPGIKFEEDAPAFDNAKFTSQTQVFLEEFGAQTVGITGTKGKSTTCSLLYTALSACSGRKTLLMGNIGKPCFDYLAEMDEESIAVFELSCHQCQRLQAAPHTAVFLNLYGDHLDRYVTMEHYFQAKAGITRAQMQGDYLLLGQNVPDIATKAQKIRVLPEGLERIGENDTYVNIGPGEGTAPAVFRDIEHFALRIPGEHNQYNARFVYEIAVNLYGCDDAAVRAAMAEFAGLPHRLEHVGCYDGVDYFDDSISTIPQATIQAVTSVPHVKTVLVGGMDRGVDYCPLEDFIRAHPDITFLLAYASGERIFKELCGGKGKSSCDSSGGESSAPANVIYLADLEAQVAMARRITPPGSAVVMSNAAASYGYFRDFEERGDIFQTLVRGDGS